MSDIMSLTIKPSTIWSDLKESIRVHVSKSNIKHEAILEGETESSVSRYFIEEIYADVSEFYYWLFDEEDDRYGQLKSGGNYGNVVNKSLVDAVRPVVEDNLEAMREAEEIPIGMDTEGLVDSVTNDLVGHILSWPDWLYDRKRDEELLDEYEMLREYEEIYVDGEYGRDNLTGIEGNEDEEGEVDDEGDF